MRQLFFLASGLLLASLTGCQDDAPQAVSACYSGVVLGTTCLDGVLIQVTSAQPVGKPVRVYQTYRDSIVGTNVIAAVNDLGALSKVGQTIYFTYTSSPNNQGPLHVCTANTFPLPAPRFILANVSTTSCASK